MVREFWVEMWRVLSFATDLFRIIVLVNRQCSVNGLYKIFLNVARVAFSMFLKNSFETVGKHTKIIKILSTPFLGYAQNQGLACELLRLQLHGAIYRPDSFVLMLRYCANLKAIRYVSTSLNRIVADKWHSLIVA